MGRGLSPLQAAYNRERLLIDPYDFHNFVTDANDVAHPEGSPTLADPNTGTDGIQFLSQGLVGFLPLLGGEKG